MWLVNWQSFEQRNGTDLRTENLAHYTNIIFQVQNTYNFLYYLIENQKKKHTRGL